MGLLEALKQYASDAAGGSLNPEVRNTLASLLNYGKDRAKYIGGLLDDSSPINQDLQNWHKRTQLGLADLIAGKEGPQADYGYSQLMNMVGVAPLGITAWHGSPHKFDKFSLDKIGTGEGAQAYGHGLYLAESPEVAQTYKQSADWRQKTMDQMKYLVDGREVMPKGVDDGLLYHYRMSAPDLFEERISHLKKQHQGSLDQAAYYAEQAKLGEDADRYARMAAKSNKTANRFAEELALAERLKSQKVEAATGHLYKTDIPDEAVARFLDWDKPLSQQAPEVRNKLLGHNVSGGRMAGDRDPLTPALLSDRFARNEGESARWAYQQLADELGGATKAADYLKQQGIPGIRYLDGGSRSAGQGSSNFVVFDPEMIRILERNGQPTGLQPWKPGEYRLGDLLK